METTLSIEEFYQAAKEFFEKSNKLNDGWKLVEDRTDLLRCYLKKECYVLNESSLFKAEYVVFYNLSYGVPSFSFNIWDSSGVLLTLERIRNMTFIQFNQKDFYSVITQQEHPLLHRPYFIIHPCHTETLLSHFKDKSKNIIVTFLGLITPLIKLDLPLEYGL